MLTTQLHNRKANTTVHWYAHDNNQRRRAYLKKVPASSAGVRVAVGVSVGVAVGVAVGAADFAGERVALVRFRKVEFPV